MAHHATRPLSFRLPVPGFAVVETGDIGNVTRVIDGGGRVHASGGALTAEVLIALGPDTETVEDRPRFATTGRIR